MMKPQFLINIVLIAVLVGCTSSDKTINSSPAEGKWRAEMKLEEGVSLPFSFDLGRVENNWKMVIHNAEEEIVVDEIYQKEDSLFIQLPIFESEFQLKIEDSKLMTGIWLNRYKSDDYKIQVTAIHGEKNRFHVVKTPTKTLAKKYAVSFSPNTEDEYKAIGLFNQKGNKLTGTFATETGDYRHLEGNITNDSLYLSTFDGSHAFLFKAAMHDSLLKGIFWSGTHFKENWIATVDPTVKLKSPDSLTFLREGYKTVDFTFPNNKGEMISLSDQKFKGKVVIIQIMGSWCPNCLDETNYLSSLYQDYKDEGLEIIALAFERTKTKEKALNNLEKLKAKTGAEYEFLLGGATRDDKAEEALPMLNHIMSYPTAIFIDKQGAVKNIHTGFYGPSTGDYYTKFVNETERLVQSMLK